MLIIMCCQREYASRYDSLLSFSNSYNLVPLHLGLPIIIIIMKFVQTVHIQTERQTNRQRMNTKYADDTYLIIPARNLPSRLVELDHIETWAGRNNLYLNRAKCVESVSYTHLTLPTNREV